MIFVTDKRSDLPIRATRLGRTLRFENGRYETDDPAEIAVLRRNRHVTAFTGEETSGPSTEAALADASRDELDELAAQAGVEGPDKLPNKDAVIEAINAARASALRASTR